MLRQETKQREKFFGEVDLDSFPALDSVPDDRNVRALTFPRGRWLYRRSGYPSMRMRRMRNYPSIR